MTSLAESYSLDQATDQWCREAEQLQQSKADGSRCGLLVRQGIVLRRQWDRTDPGAHPRRRLLTLLPALENLCHEHLAQGMRGGSGANGELAESTVQQLSEDDAYLGDLLDDPTLPPQALAFAVECFRDDLHWLGTQVAVLDGHRGVDFLGRILLEQEAIQREIGAWEDDSPDRSSQPHLRPCNGGNHGLDTSDHPAAGGTTRPVFSARQRRQSLQQAIAELQQSAQRLRTAALERQIQCLLTQSDPAEGRGWYRLWQAASHLESRLGLAGAGPEDGSEACPSKTQRCSSESDGEHLRGVSSHLRLSLARRRQQASDRWVQSILELSPGRRQEAIAQVVDELGDVTSETLTFLEELPLPDGVRSLEVLAQDIARVRRAAQQSERREQEQPMAGATSQEAELPGAKAVAAARNHSKYVERSLRQRERLVGAELQERHLAWRMEQLFGRRAVAVLERLILVLLVLFVVMLAVEGPLLQYEARNWPAGVLHAQRSRVEPVLAWIDLGICLVFLAEFTLKLCLSQRRWLYFRRSAITGLLPAIPFGFAAYALGRLAHADTLPVAEAADWFIVLRALRYLRLPQMARWLEIARPVLRMSRLIAFLLRASDRLVRQLSPLLNRNLVLFERAAITEEEPAYRTALTALRERFHYRAAEALHWLPRESQCRLLQARLEDMGAMLSAARIGRAAVGDSWDDSSPREIPVERLIGKLLTTTPAGISDRVSRALVESVARWCRAFDVFALRRLPLVRDLVAASRLPSPYDTAAQVANRIGLLFQQWLERVYWLADLYGTVTPPQLVDSIGDWLVRGTARPARRLLLIGIGFLLFSYGASLLPFTALEFVSHVMERLFGAPLIILGTLCLIPVLLGTWFRQIANEATDFYSQVAEAQFIAATRKLKRQWAQRNYAMLHRRVLVPEIAMAGRRGAEAGQDGQQTIQREQVESAAAVDLLWQEYLEGPTFHRTDTGTTNQLLGNLVMISLREGRLAYGRRQRARLRKLDLAGTRGSLRGPYLWFHFISRSLTHHTAKLVVDYNAFALPLSRAETANDHNVQRYGQWLSRRLGRPLGPSDLPEAFRRRFETMSQPSASAVPQDQRRVRQFQGNDFTALHFLSADPALATDIRQRYGQQIAELMQRDRRDNVRRVFRTYPMHRWPQEERTFNLLALYQRHMVGGLVLLVPLKLAWWSLRLAGWGLRMIVRLIGEVRHPHVAETADPDEADPFAVAVRKIHRMRKPLLLECMEMRARFDPEYLGVLLPGSSGCLRGGISAPIEEDLALIAAEPAMKRRFRAMAAERRRQVMALRAWLARFELDGQPSESLRTMSIAYTIDHKRIRSRLQATRQLQRAFEEVVAEQGPRSPLARLPEWSLRAAWCRWRYRGLLLELFEQPAFSGYNKHQRRRCRRLVYCRRGRLLKALEQLTGPKAPADPVEYGRQVLEEVGRDPAPWTRQLVILRAVQTLSVLDLKTYCDLVYELGEYGQCQPEHEKEPLGTP